MEMQDKNITSNTFVKKNIDSKDIIDKNIEEESKIIFKLFDNFDKIIDMLDSTTVSYYSPGEPMWNIMIKTRNNLENHFQKEKRRMYKEFICFKHKKKQ